MSGRVLDFANYLGGASNSQVIEVLPQQQKTFQYDFNANEAIIHLMQTTVI